jgi:hypothetical protein
MNHLNDTPATTPVSYDSRDFPKTDFELAQEREVELNRPARRHREPVLSKSINSRSAGDLPSKNLEVAGSQTATPAPSPATSAAAARNAKSAAIFKYKQTPPHLAAVPTILLQGQIFGALERGGRQADLKAKVLSHKHGLVMFSGEQFDGADGDVLERLAFLALRHAKWTAGGMHYEFTLRSLLKDVGRRDWKNDRAWLERTLTRFSKARVLISIGKSELQGPLMQLSEGQKPRHLSVIIPHEYYALLSAGFTTYDRDKRKLLRRRPLAFWLFGYLSSLLERNPVLDVPELHRLSGCTCTLREFRRLLLRALKQVEKLDCVIEAEETRKIQNNQVQITRKLNDEQRKYVEKKELKAADEGR